MCNDDLIRDHKYLNLFEVEAVMFQIVNLKHILHKKYTDFPEERFVTSVTKQKM